MIWTGGLEALQGERKWDLLGTIAAVVRRIEFLLITRPVVYTLSDDLGTIKWPSASEIRSIMAGYAS